MTSNVKCGIAGVALVAFTGVITAQSPALTRTVVTKADVSVPGREAVVARVEVAPGGVAGWHTHPGDEISYVMEGEVREFSVTLVRRSGKDHHRVRMAGAEGKAAMPDGRPPPDSEAIE